MLPDISYLRWAQRYFPTLTHDLATSGLSTMSAAELGDPGVPLDDPSAWGRFRAAVAERYRVSEAEVVPCLGASGGIFLAYASTVTPGCEVLVEQPTYEPMVRAAEGLGARVKRFVRRRERGYALDADEVLSLVTEQTRVVALTDLHNPTGVALDHGEVARLAAALEARGVYLFIDEVYAELVSPGRTTRALAPNIITTSSLTKAFGLSWIRGGFLLMPEALRAAAQVATIHTAGVLPWSTPVLAAHAFASIGRLEARRAELQRGKRAVIEAFLDRHRGALSWVPPHEGSLFGLVHDGRGKALLPMLERGASEHGVLAAAGSFFDEPSAFRLGWATPLSRLDEALSRLERALELG